MCRLVRRLLVVFSYGVLRRCRLFLRNDALEWLWRPLETLGTGQLVGATVSLTPLTDATAWRWIHRAAPPQRSDDLYEKEFQLRREQGNYFYQGKWMTAAEFEQITQQKRRVRRILVADIWLLFGAIIVITLLVCRLLWLFITA